MTPTLVLASQSPRRRQIISQLNLPTLIKVSGADEEVDEPIDPATYVSIVARRKAELVAALPDLQSLDRPIVIAADTTVVINGQILGKPDSAEEAFAVLQQLRNRDHLVHTALYVRDLAFNRSFEGVHTAVVTMRNYSDDEIRDYIATGDPLDKAGSYGIQHSVFRPVSRLDGCFLGVMGLSLCQLVVALAEIEVPVNMNPSHLAEMHEGYSCPVMPRIL